MGKMERKKGFKVCFEACSQPQTAFDVGRGQTVPVSREQGKGSSHLSSPGTGAGGRALGQWCLWCPYDALRDGI